jgi:hypothetical protein
MYKKSKNQKFLIYGTFLIYLMTLSPTQTTQRRVTEWQSEISLKVWGRGRVWPKLSYYPGIFPEGLKK